MPESTLSPIGAPVIAEPPLEEVIALADALLLDFNGTLSDDEELLAALLAEVALEGLGVPLDYGRYYSEFAGHTEEHMFRKLAGEVDGIRVDDARIGELVASFNRKYLDRTRVVRTISEESREFVAAARGRGKDIAVVTAASTDIVVPALEQADLLSQIEVVVAVEHVSRPKPDPESYLLALEMLGVDANRAVAFEDSRSGMSAALGAGLVTAAVRGSVSEEELVAATPYVIDRLGPHLLL